MTADRRSSPRHALNRDALVCSREGKPIAPCHLCDVSAEGARLTMATPELARLPDEFILVLAKRGKVHRRCRVVWRTDDEVGVQFNNV
jgi:hypothetical protein